jgi:hypothetical protein
MCRFEKEVSELSSKLTKLVDDLCEKIKQLPDNDKIHPIPNEAGVRMFVIRRRDLKDSWDPKYYHFIWQYEALVDLFKCVGPENIINRWKATKERGAIKLRTPDGWYHLIRLHPEVIKNVDQILEED